MGKLTNILSASAGDGDDNLSELWNRTAAADDYTPLPAGKYVAKIEAGELGKAKTGTPSYKIVFRILEGGFFGRRLWHDIWLTPKALPIAKRELKKLGIESPDQLERPLPQGIRCKLTVALRTTDDGEQRNEVRRFDVIGIAPPEADPFAPPADERENDDDDGDRDSVEPAGEVDPSFDPATFDDKPDGELFDSRREGWTL